MNELGDVHAHFGSWPEAVQAWHDALDCIMGPYQVNLLGSHCLAACPCCFSHQRHRLHVILAAHAQHTS